METSNLVVASSSSSSDFVPRSGGQSQYFGLFVTVKFRVSGSYIPGHECVDFIHNTATRTNAYISNNKPTNQITKSKPNSFTLLLPSVAMLARYMLCLPSVRPSVRHKPVLHRKGWTRSQWFSEQKLPMAYPILGISKNNGRTTSVLTFFQNPNLADFCLFHHGLPTVAIIITKLVGLYFIGQTSCSVSTPSTRASLRLHT